MKNSDIIVPISQKKIHCDPSLEPSRRDAETVLVRGHNVCFCTKKEGKLSLNYPCCPFLSGALVDMQQGGKTDKLLLLKVYPFTFIASSV